MGDERTIPRNPGKYTTGSVGEVRGVEVRGVYGYEYWGHCVDTR